MRILHISADYPDPLDPTKPKALSNLVELAVEHENRVFSINRRSRCRGIHALRFADAAGADNQAVVYQALPKGVLMRRGLSALARWIIEECRSSGFVPDLVHAHKLTVEGLVGTEVAAAFDAPLVLSVQGNTDLQILRAKPGLRREFRAIWHDAAVVFPFAAWAAQDLQALLGDRSGPTHLLPCPGPADAILPPEPSSAPVIRTAFHLRDSPRKNAAGLIRAIGIAANEVPNLQLEILGGGDATAFAELASLAAKVAPGQVHFLGSVPHDKVQGLFHTATAFALVSHRESFGMVFAEALMAGAPCLIPRGQGIDGYFEDGSVVLSAPSRDPAAIAAGLVRLVREETAFKDRLTALGDAGGLTRLTRSDIAARYRAGLSAALAARS